MKSQTNAQINVLFELVKDQQIKVRSTDQNQGKQKLKNRSEAYDKLTDEQID